MNLGTDLKSDEKVVLESIFIFLFRKYPSEQVFDIEKRRKNINNSLGPKRKGLTGRDVNLWGFMNFQEIFQRFRR